MKCLREAKNMNKGIIGIKLTRDVRMSLKRVNGSNELEICIWVYVCWVNCNVCIGGKDEVYWPGNEILLSSSELWSLQR